MIEKLITGHYPIDENTIRRKINEIINVVNELHDK